MRAGWLEPKRLLAGLFEGIIMLCRVVWSMDVLCWSMKQMAVSTVKDMTRNSRQHRQMYASHAKKRHTTQCCSYKAAAIESMIYDNLLTYLIATGWTDRDCAP